MKTMTLMGMLAASVVFAVTGCKSEPQQVVAKSAATSFPTVAQTALQFGAAQNDSEGYDGLAWGSAQSANSVGQLINQVENLQRIVNKVVGAPGKAERFGQYRGDPNGELLFVECGVGLPKLEYGLDEQKDAYLIYFEGKLALIVTRLKGDYAQVESDLDRKYSAGREIAADSWGDGSNDAVASHGSRVDGVFTGKLYRRGETNTRIYLLQEIVNGFKDDLYLVYIPNVYFSAIHDEWWTNYQRAQEAEAETRARQRERGRQADEKKIQ
jgi:hypothetical protein